MSNSIIHRRSNEYSFVLGFYGKCTTEECVPYDLTTSGPMSAIDSVFQVSGAVDGSFAWFKSEFVDQGINHFEQLSCGHLYYFVVKPGNGWVDIPNLYITTSSSNSLYEFDDSGRVTLQCEAPPAPVETPTPTPEPPCCYGLDKTTAVVEGNIVELDNVSGNSTKDGTLCFNSFGGASGSTPPTAYSCPFDGEGDPNAWENGGAVIVIGAEITSGNQTVTFETSDGICYKANLTDNEGMNIFNKV